jgi:FMN phosphatase YigB (HAD superfamily)
VTPESGGRAIRAIVFDLDNTLTDFMKMKAAAKNAAIDSMIDAPSRP